jgi:hypothetical protein
MIDTPFRDMPSSVRVPVLSKQTVLIRPDINILGGEIQKIF